MRPPKRKDFLLFFSLLSAFCTEWPSALDTDAKCDDYFPIKTESTDYVFAGPSLRNPLARIVHLRVSLPAFPFVWFFHRRVFDLLFLDLSWLNEVRDLQACHHQLTCLGEIWSLSCDQSKPPCLQRDYDAKEEFALLFYTPTWISLNPQ